PVERGDVRGERVELRAQAGFGIAERGVPRSLIERLVRKKPRATERVADVVFEVLDLVEVGAPVQPPLSGATFAEQRRGVAEPFTAIGEVPHLPVFEAVEVTGGAADVAVQGHAQVGSVVENYLTREHLFGKLFGRRNHDLCDTI